MCNHDWSFYTPQSGSRSGAAWGRAACLSGPRPSSPPSYIQHRRLGSRRLSSGSWWRTAPLLTSSLPALPAVDGDAAEMSTIRHPLAAIFKALQWLMNFCFSHLAKAALPQQGQEVEVAQSDPVHVTWRQAEPPVVWRRDHFLTVAQLGFLWH